MYCLKIVLLIEADVRVGGIGVTCSPMQPRFDGSKRLGSMYSLGTLRCGSLG